MEYELVPNEDGKAHYEAGVVSGQPCPTCGRKVPMTGAERQRRWRARQKLAEVHAKMSNVTLAEVDVALNMDAVLND